MGCEKSIVELNNRTMPRLVISNQFNPYLNIAVEDYLLSRPADGGATMYLWRNRRTVVIGRNQNPFAECDVRRLEDDGGYLMRRKTGGGAVYHDLGNLNFSFVVPAADYDVARQLGVVQEAVASFGLRTEVSGRNDVLCEGRKFSGNAFSKSRHARLHHGTILVDVSTEEMGRYLKPKASKLQKHGVASVRSRVVNLVELVPGLTAEDLVPRLVEAFEREYGVAQRVDFGQLAALRPVEDLRAEFAGAEWKYGSWGQFVAQRSARYDWGGVEIAVEVDEPSATIAAVRIASDSLFPDTIALAERMLAGASLLTPPAVDGCGEGEILNDIISLIYEKD